MKIYFLTVDPRIADYQEKKLRKLGELCLLTANKWTSKKAISELVDANVLIVGPSGLESLDEELFDGLPELKFVSLLTIGTGWVDLEYATRKGIVISNAKGGSAESVAEHTWGMILGLTKRINEFERDAKEKGAFRFIDYKGKEILGKTIGIIGLGDIGKKVARIAKAFDMRVLGVNKSGNKIDNIELVDFGLLLKESDVIAVCAPLTDETKGMISSKEISKMKDGVVLVNCAREEIVDKDSVMKGLDSGKIFGYGVESEIMTPLKKNDPYLYHPRVVVTPHNAFNTIEAENKIFDMMISNVENFLAGKPVNVVN